jgi:hypothetical protein
MAFVCTAARDDASFQLIKETVIIPIGYDRKHPFSYTLAIGLAPLARGDAEYYFRIVRADTQSNSLTEYWSGLSTRAFLSKGDRAKVLRALIFGTKQLLRSTSHARVFCCTHDSRLPEKALRKHALVAETFKMCGYEVKEQPGLPGKHSWWMERAQ